MVDQPSSKPLSRPFAVATALAPCVVLAGAIVVLNPGAQFERGLSSAAAVEARMMAAYIPGGKSAPAAIAGRTFEEGSEGFWLSRAPDAKNVARVTWKAPVVAGDRIIVNFGPYDRQMIDVVLVEEDTTATTRIDTGVGKTAHYVITGRRAQSPNSGLVRLTVDAEGRGLTTISSKDRAL
ncbi:MAG: hypothetical protein K2Q28_02805 [Hyphomicrobium sp.]|nr:hypothetical protein [Hyphomicrobium sp.]